MVRESFDELTAFEPNRSHEVTLPHKTAALGCALEVGAPLPLHSALLSPLGMRTGEMTRQLSVDGDGSRMPGCMEIGTSGSHARG